MIDWFTKKWLEDARERLATLTDRQFAEFFYAVTKGRTTSDVSGHFVLADAAIIEGERWESEFIALPDPGHYGGPWADDAPTCQSGECGGCGFTVRSVAKHAICPVCGASVHCS